MILIIAPEDDLHAEIVRERVLSLNFPCEILNTTMFPWVDKLTLDDSFNFLYETQKIYLDSRQLHAIWWRRFKRPTINPEIIDQHVKQYCYSEAMSFLQGIFETTHCPIYNNIVQERIASSKILQLKLAQRIGLKMPGTIISNKQEALFNFFERNDRNCIAKALKCDYPHNFETTRVNEDFFKDEQSISFAPVLLQQTIIATRDIRVTIIGTKLFAAELGRAHTNEQVDWRLTPDGWQKHELAHDISTKLIELNKALGLQFSSVDLRLGVDGLYYFLEVNANGQFLFLEIDAGHEISRELAYFLVHGRNTE